MKRKRSQQKSAKRHPKGALRWVLVGFLLGASLQWIPRSDFGRKEYNFASTKPDSGYPISHILVEREGYALAYDARTKNALWVQETITKDSLCGEGDRTHCRFKEDPLLPSHFQVSYSDYRGSGYDPGHLAPAADNKFSQLAMDETFFLSNISPQIPEFNRGTWKRLENHVRQLAKKHDSVTVITGPLFLPQEKKGARLVAYKVIGENDIAVPTHFFKVITVSGKIFQKRYGYILPNVQIDESTPLDNFAASLQEIEALSGLLFKIN